MIALGMFRNMNTHIRLVTFATIFITPTVCVLLNDEVQKVLEWLCLPCYNICTELCKNGQFVSIILMSKTGRGNEKRDNYTTRENSLEVNNCNECNSHE